jgi:hypothetical protein
VKIVVNQSHGVFKLSEQAENLLKERNYDNSHAETWRTDPILISVIEELGSEKASGEWARIKIIEIPNDVDWTISDYDGIERVVETHRSWS